ncbi:MAG: hypothetical protein L0K65_07645 [Actinomyces sp.]|nr:hypothetical protein [Actinomyces sp.]
MARTSSASLPSGSGGTVGWAGVGAAVRAVVDAGAGAVVGAVVGAAGDVPAVKCEVGVGFRDEGEGAVERDGEAEGGTGVVASEVIACAAARGSPVASTSSA